MAGMLPAQMHLGMLMTHTIACYFCERKAICRSRLPSLSDERCRWSILCETQRTASVEQSESAACFRPRTFGAPLAPRLLVSAIAVPTPNARKAPQF